MFKDFGSSASTPVRLQAPTAPALEQAADLVSRYPNLTEIELVRLINLHRELSSLDVALMIADDQLAPRLDRFFEEHRSKVRTPFRQYAALAAIALAGLLLAIWAAAFGG